MSVTADYTLWQQNPEKAFAAFIVSSRYLDFSRRQTSSALESVNEGQRKISARSAHIYQTMFARLCRWLRENGISLLQMTDEDLHRFLTQTTEQGQAVLKSAIQYRYLRMVENVFEYLARSPNPAKGVLSQTLTAGLRLKGKDANSVVLSGAQIQAFIAALPLSSAMPSSSRPHAGWKKRRDRAIQCMMLGAGLRVAEVIGLHRDEVAGELNSDGSLLVQLEPVDKHDTSYAHQTAVRPELVDDVLNWIRERDMLPVGGDLLFPGTHGELLNKATVYLQVKKTFLRAGLNLPRMGGRTLRNTFALQELDQNTSIGAVREKLELAENRSVLKYKERHRKSNSAADADQQHEATPTTD